MSIFDHTRFLLILFYKLAKYLCWCIILLIVYIQRNIIRMTIECSLWWDIQTEWKVTRQWDNDKYERLSFGRPINFAFCGSQNNNTRDNRQTDPLNDRVTLRLLVFITIVQRPPSHARPDPFFHGPPQTTQQSFSGGQRQKSRSDRLIIRPADGQEVDPPDEWHFNCQHWPYKIIIIP